MRKHSLPLVSICIPTYKRLDLLREAVESVLKNGFKEFEVIVSDDDSDPNVESMLKSLDDKRIKYFAHDKCGVQKNWTNAVRHASAQYIMKLDDDDMLLPGFLEKTVDFLENNSNVVIVFTGFFTQSAKHRRKHVDTNYFLNRPIVSGFTYASDILLNKGFPRNHKSAGVFRKSMIEQIGYFEKIGADLFFTLAAASCGDVGYIPEILFLYRYHSKVTQGMSYNDLQLCFMSVKNLFQLDWIDKSKEWQDIKSSAFKSTYFGIPILYVGNHRHRFGMRHALKTAKKIISDFEEIKNNRLIKIAIYTFVFLPGRVYRILLHWYYKYKLSKKIFNFLSRILNKTR